MAAKIAAAMITFGLHLAVGAVVFVSMLVVMNGFSESDARWGIIAFIALAAGVTLLMTAGAVVLAHRLGKREIHGVAATLIAAAVCSVIGGALVSASGFIGVAVAEIARKNF